MFKSIFGQCMILLTLTAMLFCKTFAAYSEARAKELIWVASLAYCTSDMILQRNCSQPTIETEKMGMVPIHAYDNMLKDDPITYSILVRESAKEVIFGFSGTAANMQLLHEVVGNSPVDYSIHPDIEDAQVFKYFYNQYTNYFRRDFLSQLKQVISNYSDYDFYFTGHSLGGAMTMHAAADAMLSGFFNGQKVEVYTYGQPRTGNIDFVNAFINKFDGYFRVVNYTDVVPRVPPCIPNFKSGCVTHGPLFVYPHHAPQEIFYDASGSYRTCSDQNGEDPSCSNDILSTSINHHLWYFDVDVGSAGWPAGQGRSPIKIDDDLLGISQ